MKLRKIPLPASLTILLLFGSCHSSSNSQNSYYEIRRYKKEIQNYSCQKLANEIAYVNKNLDLLNKQIKNSSFDTFMERIVSIGFYGSGKNNLERRISLFKEKQEIITINQKNKTCHEN